MNERSINTLAGKLLKLAETGHGALAGAGQIVIEGCRVHELALMTAGKTLAIPAPAVIATAPANRANNPVSQSMRAPTHVMARMNL